MCYTHKRNGRTTGCGANCGDRRLGIGYGAGGYRAIGSAKEPPPFNIQAHRCAGIALPENTLESSQWGWEHGVTPEVDLRITKDGKIVCFHDANFARVPTNADAKTKKLGVEKLTLAELQKLDVGSFRGSQYAGQRIPTLASILAEMRGHPERLLYIDIKKIDLDQLASLVREYGVERQVFSRRRSMS